jgi:HEAT repeat protein
MPSVLALIEQAKAALKAPDASVREATLEKVKEAVAHPLRDSWAALIYGATTKQVLAATRDCCPSVRAKALSAVPLFAWPGDTVKVLNRGLSDRDVGVREAAVLTLDEVGKERSTGERIAPEVVRSLAKALADSSPRVRELAVQALGRFGRDPAHQVLPSLVTAMGDKEAAVRVAAIRALRELHLDAASESVAALATALKDQDTGVRRETLATLGWLGREAERKLQVVVQVFAEDGDKGVREEAGRTLLKVGSQDELFNHLREVKEPSRRAETLRILRELREEGRALRRKLERAWEGNQGGSPLAEADEKCRLTTHAVGKRKRVQIVRCFEQWAVGIDGAKKWQLFQGLRAGWRHEGLLKGLRKGLRAKLLHAFAESGGRLSQTDALKTAAGGAYVMSDVPRLMAQIKPEMTKLRRILLAATGMGDKEDPLPWKKDARAWQARIQIGYAVKDDKGRVRFRTREELTADESIDAPR